MLKLLSSHVPTDLADLFLASHQAVKPNFTEKYARVVRMQFKQVYKSDKCVTL